MIYQVEYIIKLGLGVTRYENVLVHSLDEFEYIYNKCHELGYVIVGASWEKEEK